MRLASLSIETLLLAGYITAGCLLNLVALLISTFYHKRLNQPSPKIGFIIAIIFSLISIGLLFFDSNKIVSLPMASGLVLVGSGLISSVCISSLYLSMRKTTK